LPELPEVEIVRRRLLACLPGLVVRRVEVNDPRVSDLGATELDARLSGRMVLGLRRRGKYLIVDLEGATAVIHLRMTGQLVFAQQLGARPARFVWHLDPETTLFFQDVRRFGRLWVFDPPAETAFFAALGPEPFGAEFDVVYLRGALAGRTAPVKSFLMDQRRLAGVGNIYADEALFRARLHPLRAAGGIGPREALRLHAALLETLQAGIDHEGSSIESFVDPAGRRGRFQEILNVYQRTGEPCRVCGAAIRRIVVAGRGTHYCPRCQPRRGRMAPGSSPRPASFLRRA
jgi:formamidopyrimidine-DNA glycosylase